MTGLETAIILIAFVTVAAVFGYAVLSAGLFSAERGKETIYAGLSESRSNMELSGSIMAKSSDSTNLSKIIFTVKNAIAGSPIDLTPCNGTSSAANKCIISLTTASQYFSNIKWTRQAIGTDNGNNLLDPGEQFEITVNLADLGDNISLSDNLTANDKFTLQVKPAIGASMTIQRTLPAAIGPIMDLDLGASFGGGTGSSSGSSGGTISDLECTSIVGYSSGDGYLVDLFIKVQNNGTSSVTIDLSDVTITSDAGTHAATAWQTGYGPITLQSGEAKTLGILLDTDRLIYNALDLNDGETFIVRILAGTSHELNIQRTLPNPMEVGGVGL
jgi:flagellin FlaB